MRFLTIVYVCSTCRWSVRVKTAAVPKHALFYRQAIPPTLCLRCRQKAHLANCLCCKKTEPAEPEEVKPVLGTPIAGNGDLSL